MKKILLLLVLTYGCTKNDSIQPQPSSFISFYNGSDTIQYSGRFAGNGTGIGYYYETVNDSLYQYDVYGGAGNNNYLALQFFTNDTTSLKTPIDTTLVIGLSYSNGDSVYVGQNVTSSIHIDGNNHNVLNGSFSGILTSVRGSNTITISNGTLANVPFSH